MTDLKKRTEAMLRAVLISSSRGVPLRRLDREYKSITHQPVPFLELGFSSLEEFIRSIPHVASLARDVDGDVLVKGVASESDQHVAKLIAKQKKPKIKGKAKSRRPLMRPQVVTPRSTVPRIGPRFVPPRLKKQSLSQATAQTVSRSLIERQGVSRQVQRDVWTFANFALNSNSSRKVELVSAGVKAPRTGTATGAVTVVPCQVGASKYSWNDKPRWTGNGTYCQEMEVCLKREPDNPSGYDRVVKVSQASNAKTTNQGVPQGKENLEIYSQIKKLLETKPKGLWLTRIGAEYKKSYGCELPSDILEQLKSLPHVARCEQFPGGSILYPSRMPEERSVDKNLSHQNSGSESSRPFEFYTLRPQEPPPKGATREVSVSHIESVSHFFVHYKSNWEKIDNLQSQLEDFFLRQSSKKNSLPMLKEGMFCCAQFTADDAWYRARITQCYTDALTVQVIYVDFGNFETLPASRLCLLRREHAELPMLAVLCTLEGVKPSNQERDEWNSTSVERFRELCTAIEELRMTVVGLQDHHLVVQLTDANGTDIKAALLKESHTVEESETSSSTSTSTDTSSSISSSETSSSSASSSSVPSVSHLSASSTSEMQVKELEQRQNNIRPFLRHRFFSRDDNTFQKVTETVQMPEDDYVDVFVCNVHSTDNICVNFYGEEYSDKLAAIEQGMLCHFEEPSSQETPAEVNAGSIFAVYSKDIHSEGLWYRVKVHKVKGDKAHVEYMDYGETGTIPVSSLRCIPLRFLELPFQACSLSLHGLPKTKNPEVVLKIKHLVLGKQLVAEVVKRVGDTVSVELYDMSSEVEININTVLRSLVIPDDELAPVLPKVGEQIDVFVTFVEGSKVFIQIPGGGTSRLEELLNDISEHYSQPIKAAEFVSKPQPEIMCCAKSSDGSWYRAMVTKVLPGRQVEVQYVDYGNFEQLAISSLREPAKAISHVNSLPFQALQCHLEGLNENTWSSDLAHKLEETVLERNAVLEVVSSSDIPVVRLFLPSDDHDEGLVSVAKLIGLEKASLVPMQEDLTATGEQEWVDDGSIDGDSVVSETSSTQDEIDKKAFDLPLALNVSRSFVDIIVIEAEDPSSFVFQCLECLGELQIHENKIQQYYLNKKRTPLKDIRAGVLCAAHHASDDTWYRALVKAALSPQQVCVCFVDYGDFGIVPSHSLQHLPEEFRELPFMAVQGSLQGVEPVGNDTAEWCNEAKRRFEELTVEKKLVAKLRRSQNYGDSFGEKPKVQLELYDTSDPKKDVLIADVLVNEGLAKRIADHA